MYILHVVVHHRLPLIILVGESVCVINLNLLYIKAHKLLVISHRSYLLSKCTYAYSSIYKLDQGLKLHLYHQNAHKLILAYINSTKV